MSGAKGNNRHVLVLWIKENELSITDECFVKEKALLSDPERVGLVEHGSKTGKKPKDGWRTYPARVLAVSGKIKASLTTGA